MLFLSVIRLSLECAGHPTWALFWRTKGIRFSGDVAKHFVVSCGLIGLEGGKHVTDRSREIENQQPLMLMLNQWEAAHSPGSCPAEPGF
jgi:hypothetical protein